MGVLGSPPRGKGFLMETVKTWGQFTGYLFLQRVPGAMLSAAHVPLESTLLRKVLLRK